MSWKYVVSANNDWGYAVTGNNAWKYVVSANNDWGYQVAEGAYTIPYENILTGWANTKAGGIVCRFGAYDQNMADLFYQYGYSHTQSILNVNNYLTENHKAGLQAVQNKNIDVGVWVHDQENMAVATLIDADEVTYFEGLDDGAPEPGVKEMFYHTDGDIIMLSTLDEPTGLIEGDTKISCDITPEAVDSDRVKIDPDSPLTGAATFGHAYWLIWIPDDITSAPSKARGKYWCVNTPEAGDYKTLAMHHRIDFSEYCKDGGGTPQYFADTDMFRGWIIPWNSIYPTNTGFEYILISAQRHLTWLELGTMYSYAETEAGGLYKSADDEDWLPCSDFGLWGATRAPTRLGDITYHNPETFRYRIVASSASALSSLDPTTDEAKILLAEFYVKHKLWHDRSLDADAWGLENWGILLSWANANNIPVVSYAGAGYMMFDITPGNVNLIPDLSVDMMNEGKPTGWTIDDPGNVTWLSTGGNTDYCFKIDAASANEQVDVVKLGGIESGINDFKLYLKNDGTAIDTVEVKIKGQAWLNTPYNEYYSVTINSINHELKELTYTIPAVEVANDSHLFDVEIKLKTKNSSGSVYISDFDMRKQ